MEIKRPDGQDGLHLHMHFHLHDSERKDLFLHVHHHDANNEGDSHSDSSCDDDEYYYYGHEDEHGRAITTNTRTEVSKFEEIPEEEVEDLAARAIEVVHSQQTKEKTVIDGNSLQVVRTPLAGTRKFINSKMNRTYSIDEDAVQLSVPKLVLPAEAKQPKDGN